MHHADGKPDWRVLAGCAAAVFLLAVLIRLPSCCESFWLDELHTAWAIWGDLGDVAPRAEVGNQTPLYFQIMWVWKEVVGESEIALRGSSVLAVSFASALLVIAVTVTTGQVFAGVLAGLVLAVESNSIFFGTELRPYAWLLPLTVIAIWAAVEWLSDREVMAPPNLRLVLTISICLSALVHPTSMVTLGVLAGVVTLTKLLTGRQSRDSFHFHVSEIASVVVVVATVFALANSSLPESWSRRESWRSFGAVSEVTRLLTVWSWTPLVLVPFTIGLVTVWKRPRREKLSVLLPLLVAVTSTSIFFVAAYNDYVPLWHRRYFIAALPMLAWFAGAWPCIGLGNASWLTRGLGAGMIVVVLSALMGYQGTARRLMRGDLILASRGEDWRGAVAWVNATKDQSEVVWLDSGLIEARIFSEPFSVDLAPSQLQWQYFRFPVSGPYPLPDVNVATPGAKWGHGGVEPGFGFTVDRADRKSLWIISRSSPRTLEKWCRQLLFQPEFEIHSFGRLYVARLYGPTADQLLDQTKRTRERLEVEEKRLRQELIEQQRELKRQIRIHRTRRTGFVRCPGNWTAV